MNIIEKLNELSFVIGTFFVIIALILIGGYFLTTQLANDKNLYTGLGMLVFGLIMLRIKSE
ncbi:MAG: hypothetical protein ACK5AO_07460 [bacterium]|jgi:hypothetical protein